MDKKMLLIIPNEGLIEEKKVNVFSVKNTIIVVSLLIGFIITLFVGSYSNKVQSDIASNLLRLHVIANSDTKEDQELKLKVRDAIINEMSSKFSLSNSIEDTKKIANENINNIENVAKKIINENNKDYEVKVSVANTYFPTKYYGDIALPPGDNDALRVQIGEAKGANWWCVLFPPLCFVDATNGKLPEESKEKLKASISQEEYELINTASADEKVPVKIKFKSVEIWQQSKHKVEVAISNIF